MQRQFKMHVNSRLSAQKWYLAKRNGVLVITTGAWAINEKLLLFRGRLYRASLGFFLLSFSVFAPFFCREKPGVLSLKWVAFALVSGGNHDEKGEVQMEEKRRDGVRVMGGDHGYEHASV